MAPQDQHEYRGQLERRFVLIHIPKTGGTTFLEESPQHMPAGYTLSGNGERSIHQTPAHKQNMVVLLREPIHHVVSQFLMCKYSMWGRTRTRKSNAVFPGQWSTRDDFNYKSTFAGLNEWVQHFVNQEKNSYNETILGAAAAFYCYNPWNMQTRQLSIAEQELDGRPKHSHFVFDFTQNRFPPLHVAKKHVDQVGFVGITEYLDASICLFEFGASGFLSKQCQCDRDNRLKRSETSTPIVWDVPRYNMSDLDNATKGQIEELVQIDISLYEYVVEKLRLDLKRVRDVTGVDLSCGQIPLLGAQKKTSQGTVGTIGAVLNDREGLGNQLPFGSPPVAVQVQMLTLLVLLMLLVGSKLSIRPRRQRS